MLGNELTQPAPLKSPSELQGRMDSIAFSHGEGSLLAEPPEQPRPAMAHLGGFAG